MISHSTTCRPALSRRTRRLSLLDLLSFWQQRRMMRELSEETLADIGLTRQDAEKEARKLPWDVPSSWRQD